MHKIIRVTTPSLSFKVLMKGQTRHISKFYNVTPVCGDYEFANDIKVNEGLDCHVIPMKRNISIVNDIISIIKLFIFFKKKKPEIVHSITPKAGLLSMIAAYFAGVPIRLHTYTGLIFPSKTNFKKQVLIFTDKVTCYFATSIYSDGNGVKKDLINHGITKKRVKVLNNGSLDGVDINFFNKISVSSKLINKLQIDLNISKKDFVFIYVGRLVTDKGINELVTAFNELSKKYLNIKLLLVGPFEKKLDPLNNSTLDLIKSNKQIISTGFQDDVRPYFSISDVFILPSYREGFPTTVLQAGSMGLPSIVTNVNGCNEIIKHNINGLIIPSKNISSLKNSMLELYKNTKLYNNLHKKSRKMIKNNYNQDLVRDNLIIEYTQLLDNIN